ncbi:MAG: D-aminoacyl-tRNA deacylase [Lachnospirales bacterium]
MKVIIQRVLESSVSVENNIVGSIGRGFLVFLGVTSCDTKKDVEVIVEKISKLRIFPDEQGKVNLSINDIKGEVLVVSQFTLYAQTKKGNRPSFVDASKPELANELYEYFKVMCKEKFANVQCGVFGADMKVSIINDGPFTIIMEAIDGNIL